MKKEYKHQLIDTYCEGGYSYSDYVEDCEDNNIIPAEEDSREYWEWIGDRLQWDWEVLLDNIKFSKNNGRCIVYGTLGRWNGEHTINEKVFNSLIDAFNACAINGDAVQIWETNGTIEFHTLHHDGTDIFYIKPINEKRATNKDKYDIEEANNPLWYASNYPEYIF